MIASDLVPGQAVETVDHHRLGSLESVAPDRILVRPRLQPPYWLPAIAVRERSLDGGITLHLTRQGVRRYRQTATNTGGDRKWPFKQAGTALMAALATIGLFPL